MEFIVLIGLFLLACFTVVLLFGAPYLPTHRQQIGLALGLLDLKKGQTLYELGCGDGRLLNAAAKKGYKAVGYEMNPVMYVWAKLNTYKNRSTVSVKYGNFWNADLKNADGVFVFLLDRFMTRLDDKLSAELKPGVRLASYAFKIPDKKTTAVHSGIFVYEY